MERGIQEFFGEAFFNILNFLSECQQDMPNGNEIQMRIEVVDSAKAFVPAALLAKPAKASKVTQRKEAALV
jgi:RecA/RadA recombinase